MSSGSTMGDSQAEFDRENLNEDVARMRGLWINEMVRLCLCAASSLCVCIGGLRCAERGALLTAMLHASFIALRL